MKKIKGVAVNIGLVVGAIAFAVAIAEIGLRVAGIESQPPPRLGEKLEPKPLYNFEDTYRGWGGNPNATGYWDGEGEHGEVRMNSAGFRDRERYRKKPANGLRIALMGDSFVEGLYLREENTYGAVMEKKLKQCPVLKDKEVEVLNFGAQGYGTAQELMTMRNYVWDYSPDLVILNFYAGNDLRNNYRPLEHDHLRPYFVYEDGKLVEDMSFRELEDWERDRYAFSKVDFLPIWLVRNSRILQLIRKIDIERKIRKQIEEYEDINIGFYREPAPGSDWDEAWKVTEALIRLMRDEVYEKGADFMLVTTSDSYQVLPDAARRDWFRNHYNLPDLFYPDRRLRDLGKEEDFPVFNLAGVIWNVAKETGRCLHGFDNSIPCGGHWNVEGSKVAGETIADYLCQTYTVKLANKKEEEKNEQGNGRPPGKN